MTSTVDEEIGPRLTRALELAAEYFMGEANVQHAMRALARRLDEAGIPYAIAGGLALAAHGFIRVTEDVDVLLDRAGLEALKARYLGRGYVELFKGSKGIRDTEHRVKIDILITGDFPGDGKPKAVAFPRRPSRSGPMGSPSSRSSTSSSSSWPRGSARRTA